MSAGSKADVLADEPLRGVGRQVLATLALTAYLVAVLALASLASGDACAASCSTTPSRSCGLSKLLWRCRCC